jgi:hypothetical protein
MSNRTLTSSPFVKQTITSRPSASASNSAIASAAFSSGKRDGKASHAMEAHFVHAAEDGGLAAVGVFIVSGRHNAVFNKIVRTMPTEEGPPVPADPAIGCYRPTR